MSRKPSVRNRRIGMELKRLREQRGLSMVRAGNLLERSPSSISYIENGFGIHARVLAQTLDRYEVTDESYRAALLELARADRKTGWWQRHARELSPDVMDFISLEAEARTIRTYEVLAIPGLFQTPAYALALTRASQVKGAERAVKIRMKRQQILNEADPPHLSVVLGEAVLRQLVGGREVMRDQLGNLVEATRSDNVALRIIPFETGAHLGFSGAFTIVEIGNVGRLSVVMLETPERMTYVENSADVRLYVRRFDRLSEIALPEPDSRTLIERLRSDL